MAQPSSGRELFNSLQEKIPHRILLALAILALSLVAISFYETNSETDINLLLQNNTDLNYTDGNRIGTLIIRDNSIIRRYEHPEYKACVYTPENETPMILDVNTVETSSSSNTRNMALTIDIPLEEISERDFSQTLSIRSSERCLMYAEPGITVTEK